MVIIAQVFSVSIVHPGGHPVAIPHKEFGVHDNQINLWKKQLLEAAPKVFSRGKGHEAERLNQERDRLYRKVGQLQVEVDWLKKKTGLPD